MSQAKISVKSLGIKCRYVLPDDENYKCPHPVISANDGTLCRFHAMKSSEDDQTPSGKLTPQQIERRSTEFTNALYEVVEKAVESKASTIDFRGFVFSKIEFRPQAFLLPVDFSYSVFLEDVDFSVNTPSDEEEYARKLLYEGADFRHTEFKKEVSLEYLQSKRVSLNKATVEGNLILDYAKIDKLFITDSEVVSDLIIEKGRFEHFSISGTVFQGEVEFFRVSVFKSLSAMSCEFQKSLYIDESYLGGDWYLGPTQVTELAADENVCDLSSSEFGDGIRISSTYVLGGLDFFHVRLLGQTELNFREGALSGELKFHSVTLPKDSDLVFEGIDLAKASFHETNLEKIVFRDVTWAVMKTNWLRKGSFALYDEVRSPSSIYTFERSDDAKTAENYSMLVKNYENRRDFETAEHFHIGEMELRRKLKGYKNTKFLSLFSPDSKAVQWFRRGLNGYAVYLFSSRYGANYWQAFFVLILLLVLSTVFFMHAGLQATESNKLDEVRVINYDLFGGSSVSVWKLLSDFGKTLVHTLEVGTFQKEKYYEPTSWWGRLLIYPVVISLASQTAFVLLAIRRRYKR